MFGWLASAPFAWPYIKAGFDSGDPTKGVFRFVLVVFGAGLACGAIGLVLGSLGGYAWERFHRHRRATRPAIAAVGARATPLGTPSATAAPRATTPLPPLAFDHETVTADEYIALARRVVPDNYDRKRTRTALTRSINVGAWDGDRLVGIARILSDGYFFAALADLMVDPEFQRRGLGRELMNRAFDKTPRGALFIGAEFGTAAFFDRLGCERGPSGFTMHRASHPASLSLTPRV